MTPTYMDILLRDNGILENAEIRGTLWIMGENCRVTDCTIRRDRVEWA